MPFKYIIISDVTIKISANVQSDITPIYRKNIR